MLSTTAKWISL